MRSNGGNSCFTIPYGELALEEHQLTVMNTPKCSRILVQICLVFLMAITGSPLTAQQKHFFGRFGITDLDLREQAQTFLTPEATLEISRFGEFLNGATGVDFIGRFNDTSRWHYECGIYYNSTTLVGNPQFRVKYTSTLVNFDTTAYLSADFQYGDARGGVGYRVTNLDRDFILMPMVGVDLEFGRITLVSDVIDFTLDEDGSLVPRNITPDGTLLLGFYSRVHMGFTFGRKDQFCFLITPGIRYTFKLEDDYENDSIDADTTGKLAIDFTSGIGVGFD